MARPENRNTTDAPMIRPTRFFGSATSRIALYCRILRGLAACAAELTAAVWTASVNEPNSAVAASTAVAIAMPLVMALVVLPTASSSVRTCRALAVDVAGHLGDALRVVGDRAEGVHRDDDADGGEQAGAGERDANSDEDDRAAAEQERAEDRGTDEQRGVDGRLQAER